jgi:hypothetical protein
MFGANRLVSQSILDWVRTTRLRFIPRRANAQARAAPKPAARAELVIGPGFTPA